jgi:GNAT superfamily N-acetyltransferase
MRRVEIRRVAADEWERFRDIRLRALGDAPFAFGSTLAREQERPAAEWRERLGRRDGAMFACVDGDAWLGIAGAYADPDVPALVWVVSMWVAPEGRRRGAGRRLLDTCVAWARRHGATEVRLWVTTTNEPARALYEAAGFEPTGATQPLPSDPSLDELELSLRL